MKRKKFYTILVILATISLFSFAALCNPSGAVTEVNVEVSGNETGDEDDTDTEKETPTIILEIYEGPIYLVDDEICYSRIEATVTGKPKSYS